MTTTETLATPSELRPGDEILAVVCVDGVTRYARNPAVGSWLRVVHVTPPSSYPVVLATFRDGIPAPVTLEAAHADWRGVVVRRPATDGAYRAACCETRNHTRMVADPTGARTVWTVCDDPRHDAAAAAYQEATFGREGDR